MSVIAELKGLYDKYYSDNPELCRIVRIHSEQVAKKALTIVKNKKLPIDFIDIYYAAMLHDIGVVKCKAPDIHAFGHLPYLQHGLEGKKMLVDNGFTKYANICASHTGAGISAEDIRKNHLPLPENDYLPDSILEKLICYADKFYSKSHDLTKEKKLSEVFALMKKFGPGSYQRFLDLHALFGDDLTSF